MSKPNDSDEWAEYERKIAWRACRDRALIGLLASGRYSTANYDVNQIIQHAEMYADQAQLNEDRRDLEEERR